VTSDLIDFFVRQPHGLVAQQLAITIDRDRIRSVRRNDLFHRFPKPNLPDHHVSASFGLDRAPGQGRKPAERVERSESLDGAEASPTIGTVMARHQLTFEPACVTRRCNRVHGTEVGASMRSGSRFDSADGG